MFQIKLHVCEFIRTLFILTLAISIAQLENSAAQAEFTHPGVAHSQADIDFVKAKIALGEEPWASAWRSVQVSRYADLQWRPQPHANVERGPYNNPNIGSSEFSADASATLLNEYTMDSSNNKSKANSCRK